MGFRPVEKALFLTTSERARFKDLAVRFRMLSPTISDRLSPKEQERELKKATVTATTNPSITVPNHKPALETLDQETKDSMSKVDSPLRRNPGAGDSVREERPENQELQEAEAGTATAPPSPSHGDSREEEMAVTERAQDEDELPRPTALSPDNTGATGTSPSHGDSHEEEMRTLAASTPNDLVTSGTPDPPAAPTTPLGKDGAKILANAMKQLHLSPNTDLHRQRTYSSPRATIRRLTGHQLPYVGVQGAVTYSSEFTDEFSVVEDGSASPGHQLFHTEELSAIVEEDRDYDITEYSYLTLDEVNSSTSSEESVVGAEIYVEYEVTERSSPGGADAPRRSTRIRCPPRRLEISLTGFPVDEISQDEFSEEFRHGLESSTSEISAELLGEEDPDDTFMPIDMSPELNKTEQSMQIDEETSTASADDIVQKIRLILGKNTSENLEERLDGAVSDGSVSATTDESSVSSMDSVPDYTEYREELTQRIHLHEIFKVGLASATPEECAQHGLDAELVGALDRHDTSSHQRDNYLKALGAKLEKQSMWLDMIDTPGDVIIQSAVEMDRQAQGLPAGIGFWGFVEGMRSECQRALDQDYVRHHENILQDLRRMLEITPARNGSTQSTPATRRRSREQDLLVEETPT